MHTSPAYQLEGSALITFGWVHVTGLRVRPRHDADLRIIKPDIDMLGKGADNNGFRIIVTERGKVWIKYGHEKDRQRQTEEESLLEQLCPHGRGHGMMVAGCAIATGGDQILTHELLSRVHDPLWEPEN